MNVPIVLTVTQTFDFAHDETIDAEFTMTLNIIYELTEDMLFGLCYQDTIEEYTGLEPIEMEVIDLE